MDINAPNFIEMFQEATSKTDNNDDLFRYTIFNPKYIIKIYSGKNSEAIREVFENLYNEDLDLEIRIKKFTKLVNEIRKNTDQQEINEAENTDQLETDELEKKEKEHPGYEAVISTYLWLRYPTKYYISRYFTFKAFAEMIGIDFKREKNNDNDIKNNDYNALINRLTFYDDIKKFIGNNKDLDAIINKNLTNDCYDDPSKKYTIIRLY